MLQHGRESQPPVRPTPMTMDNRRRNLGFFFDQSVARLPEKVAIIDLFGGKERRATYRQLDSRMNRVASMLARLGVAPGERVAMVIGNRTEFIEFFFGSMRAGAIPSRSTRGLRHPRSSRSLRTRPARLRSWIRRAIAMRWRSRGVRRCVSSLISARRAFCPSRTKWPNLLPLSIRLKSRTMRKRSSPIRRDRPAAPKAQS
jgi:non-ribosomal peptide synthetase component F